MDRYTGGQYLQIDIASQYGLDKELFPTRIDWVKEHEDHLESLVDEADSPFQYLAAVMAYRDAQNGIPTGHIIDMDACASGLQLFAAMTGCKVTARNTGLTGKVRGNIYARGTEAMAHILGTDVDVDPEAVKKAIMTYFYGSDAKPKQLFGDGTEEYYAFHKANKIIAPGGCEGRDLLLDSWQDYALSHNWTMPDGYEVKCKVMVPDDSDIEVDCLDHATFVYRHDVNQGILRGEKGSKSVSANPIHSCDALVVRELCRRCNYDIRLLIAQTVISRELSTRGTVYETSYTPIIEQLAERSGFVSLVGIEHVNHVSVVDFGTEYLIELLKVIDRTLLHKSFPVVTVHDNFKAHPNNVNEVRQTYIDIMAEIAESNMLEFILNQFRIKNPVKIQKYSDDLADEIRNGEYALS